MDKSLEATDTEWEKLAVRLERAGLALDLVQNILSLFVIKSIDAPSSVAGAVGIVGTSIKWRAFNLRNIDDTFREELATDLAVCALFHWNHHCERHGQKKLIMRLIRVSENPVFTTSQLNTVFKGSETNLEMAGYEPESHTAEQSKYKWPRIDLADADGNRFYCEYWVKDGKLFVYRYHKYTDDGKKKYKDYLVDGLQVLKAENGKVVVWRPYSQEK